jgi:DNA-binding response OmpR family regulator
MPNAALLDYLLPDGNGVELGVQLQRRSSKVQIIVMTGAQLSPEEEAICQEYDFPVLRKPFLANDILNLIRARLFRSSAISVTSPA